MKEKYRIIQEDYNPETFESVVVIETAIGRFEGRTVAKDIDKEYPSMLHGNQIALSKALKAFCKSAIRILKAEVAVLDSAYNIMCQEIDHYWELESFKEVSNYIDNKHRELTLWKARYHNLGKIMVNRCNARERIFEKYVKKGKED